MDREIHEKQIYACFNDATWPERAIIKHGLSTWVDVDKCKNLIEAVSKLSDEDVKFISEDLGSQDWGN